MAQSLTGASRQNIQLMLARSLQTVSNWSKELDDNPDEVPALTKRIPLSVETSAWQYLNAPVAPKYIRLNYENFTRVFFLVIPEEVAPTYPADITP